MGMRGLRLRSLGAFGVALLLLSSCTEQKRPERLTLYCGATRDWCDVIATEFERETGIAVSMTRKGSGETLAQIRAEKRNPRADVWWGGTGDAHLQAAEDGLTEGYLSPMAASLHPWAKDPAGKGEHRTTGVYLGVLGFAYNREWLLKRNIAPPKGWKDLTDARFRGEIQMANPQSSGTAYTALATVVQLFGEDEAFRYLKALNQNISQYTQSGVAPARAVARGEAGVGIVFVHDALVERAAGFPVEIVLPEEGTGFEIGSVSIVRGARHPENAKKFVDWALSPNGQNHAAKARALQWQSHPSSKLPDVPFKLEDAKLIEFDFRRWGKSEERKRLLTRFEDEVRAGS